MGIEHDLDAHASLALGRAKQLYVRTPDATHRRLLATAAETALNDGLSRQRVLFWLRISDGDLDDLLEFLKREKAGTNDARFLVQAQPVTGEHPTDTMSRLLATLAEAEEVGAEIRQTIDTEDVRIFITDEQTGRQLYLRRDGSWAPTSAPIDYEPENT
jgi:hypothetical protein